MDSRETGMSNLANGLGKKVRAALDADSAASDEVRQGRKHFIDYVATHDVERASVHRWSWLPGLRGFSMGLGGAAAVAAAVLIWTRLPISFQVDSDSGPAAVAGNPGDLIEANAVVPTAVRFSEGSSIVLERGGRLRVLSLESNGARVLVEKGAADVAIAHRRAPGKWRFEAGPVTVDVTGTRFRVDWNPEDRSFGIDLKEGSVIVGGDCLPTPRRVQRGDNMRISCGTPAKTKLATADVPAPAPAPSSEEKATPAHSTQALARHELRDVRSSDEGDWRALVAAGHYAEGVRAAEHVGWSRVCRSANAVELLSLADAARLSDQAPRAVEALLALRQRFPGSTSAATGAFSLGRLAFEKRGAYAEAARWFARYLDEQPDGPLMGDAVGRLMEARHRAGDRPAARRDAERYLQRFPEGPYAGTARAILAAAGN
jgi:transmembrane sensor